MSDIQVLLCGSRAGAVAAFADVRQHATSGAQQICRRRVHGEDTVTSIHRLSNFEEKDDLCMKCHFLTTGRDGHYCALRLDLTRAAQNDSWQTEIHLVHKVAPPLGPNIEGADLVQSPNGQRNLVLHGFRSKHFVVWDETNQTQTSAVECGGAHRSWSFRHSNSTVGSNVFAWTQAGTFNYYEQSESDHKVILKGGHGREIKALAVHKPEKHRWLIATGSEDTDIRLFEYILGNAGGGEIKNTCVLRKHTTGLQALRFSSDGSTLISAAGMEEMFAWTLSPLPVINQGVVFAGSLPSTDRHSDARIMSFDIKSIASSNLGSVRLFIVAAFSNGKAKLIQYDNPGETGNFVVLRELDFGMICLTQAYMWLEQRTETNTMEGIISATNGQIARYCISSPPHEYSNSPAPALQAANTSIQSQWQHKVHQNSITALHNVHLNSGHDLVVTGGDDNALAFTIASRMHETDKEMPETFRYRSLIIPKAHAAALTALTIIELGCDAEERRVFVVITAGNDQRVQTWLVKIILSALPTMGEENSHASTTSSTAISLDLVELIQIDFLAEQYTNVADISNLAVMSAEFPSGKAQVLVVGIGMETVDVVLPVVDQCNINT
ncbi:WD repeat-containing protein 6 [Lithohypha guttulata]|nr:WD repeat-containing protein 6 [Lithohypha guttulata]